MSNLTESEILVRLDWLSLDLEKRNDVNRLRAIDSPNLDVRLIAQALNSLGVRDNGIIWERFFCNLPKLHIKMAIESLKKVHRENFIGNSPIYALLVNKHISEDQFNEIVQYAIDKSDVYRISYLLDHITVQEYSFKRLIKMFNLKEFKEGNVFSQINVAESNFLFLIKFILGDPEGIKKTKYHNTIRYIVELFDKGIILKNSTTNFLYSGYLMCILAQTKDIAGLVDPFFTTARQLEIR